MRGQTLPWIAINVVGMIMFVIILISILSMQKNFYMTVKELDKRTALMQMGREFLTSPNCVADEFTDYAYINSTRRVKLIDVVEPGVVDYNKYMDFYHFNCMRFDSKNIDSGMTMAYATNLTDVNTGTVVNPPIDGTWPPNGTVYSYEAGAYQFEVCISTGGGTVSIFGGYPPNCSDSLYQIQPVVINKDGELHLGILDFYVCEDKSKDYKGTHFCEQNLK